MTEAPANAPNRHTFYYSPVWMLRALENPTSLAAARNRWPMLVPLDFAFGSAVRGEGVGSRISKGGHLIHSDHVHEVVGQGGCKSADLAGVEQQGDGVSCVGYHAVV